MNSYSDLLSSISVLLVFLTILIAFISTELNAVLDTIKPEKTRPKERNKFIKHLRQVLLLKSLPVTLIFLIVSYTLLPKTIEIFKTSEFAFWDFDSLRTIFLFIELGLIGFTFYSIIQTIRLIMKLIND